jgi:hypothetical protein
MLFDTKIALVIRDDLVSWQQMNVAAFLASGIAASYPESIGDPYEDASGNSYLRLIGHKAPSSAPPNPLSLQNMVTLLFFSSRMQGLLR